MEKVKILRIINRLNIGGPSLNAAFLTKYLNDYNYQSELLYGQIDRGEESALHLFDELDLEPVLVKDMHRKISFANDLKAFLFIYKYIKRYKPDIVHTHASKAGLLGRTAAKLAGVKIIVHTFHGNVFDGYFGKIMTFIILTIERMLGKISTRIISISETQKKDLVEKYNIVPENKISIVKLGFDLTKFQIDQLSKRNSFRDLWNISENELVLSIIGRLAPIKNHFLFLDAISSLKHSHGIRFRAMVVGDGELLESLLNYCANKNLTYTYGIESSNHNSDIIFTSWIKDVDSVVAASDIVCLTSINEGTPVCLIEAVSAGRPVVSTKVGGIEDILSWKEGAILCGINEEEYSRGLIEMIKNLEMYKLNAANAANTIIEKFSYKRLVNDIDELYKICMNDASV